MLSHLLLLGGLAAAAKVENLVLFGDSYTDEGRLVYLLTYGSLPPPGTVIPHENVTAAGTYSWPYYAAKKLGATTYNYAGKYPQCLGYQETSRPNSDALERNAPNDGKQSVVQSAPMKSTFGISTRVVA